jgi:hypothetical protein
MRRGLEIVQERPRAPGRPADAEPRGRSGGVAGNERLTASTGAVLFVLLALEGATVPFTHDLLPYHIFFGVLLIPPVLLKVAATGHRMIRYYAGNAAYRLRGAPQTAMRLLGPLLVLSTVGVLGTGVALLVAGPRNDALRGLHSLAFIAFFATCGIHVLVHVWRVPFLASLDWRRIAPLPGSTVRRVLVVASVLAGVGAAAVAVAYDGTWLHWFSTHHRDFRGDH